jgi:hypothetical protein
MVEYRKDLQHSDRDRRGKCRYFDTPLDGIEIFRHLIPRIRAEITISPSLSYGTDLLFPLAAPPIAAPTSPRSASGICGPDFTPELSIKQLPRPEFFLIWMPLSTAGR